MLKNRLIWLVVLFFALAVVFVGCDNEDDDGDSQDSADDDDDDDSEDDPLENLEVSWESCSLYEGADDGRAECSYTEAPFDWLLPDDRTFTVAAKRLPADGKATAQIWLLHGGPGASGTIGYPSFMEYLQSNVPGLEVYTLDLRGTGYSEYLECPDQEDPASPASTSLTVPEAIQCADYLSEKWGDDLRVFSNTQGAYDLGAMIHHSREEGVKTFVYGASGGAYWALRYLNVFPDQIEGVVIEGIATPDFSIAFQDEYADKAVRKIFEMCGSDLKCSAQLPDPEQTLYDLYDKLDQGHCSNLGLSSDYVRIFFDQLSYYYPWYTTIPSIIYRLDRCNEDDIDAIARFWNQVWGGGKKSTLDTASRFFSEPLFFNQLSSELWEYKDFADNDMLLAYLDSVYATSLIGYEKGYSRNDVYLAWDRYTDPLDDQWPETEIPLLMLNGVLDPSTPNDFASQVQDHFNGSYQNFYQFDYCAHGTTGSSPYENDQGKIEDCANEMFFGFLHDPESPPDASCIVKTLPPDFSGGDYAGIFYGTADFWGDEAGSSVLGANQSKSMDPFFESHRQSLQSQMRRAMAGL